MDRFQHQTYVIRRKVLKLVGGAFHVYDAQGQVLFYSELKAFKLKEDIRLYSGEDKRQELLTIKARQIIDIAATYDVVDAATGQKVGALKRRGLKSVLRDEWDILDAGDRVIGKIQEESMFVALLRRFLSNLIPQHFKAEMNGVQVASYDQNFNPFVLRLTVDLSRDPGKKFDRRLALGAGILLCAIEGRQG
jgi:uncharacterized protein YxjI